MSEWETRLTNLAQGSEWRIPNLDRVGEALTALTTLMNRVASDPGIKGSAEREVTAQMDAAKSDIGDLIDYVKTSLPRAIQSANDRRESARNLLAQLGPGGLSSDQQSAIRNAADGAKFFFGGFSVIAGEGAIAAANWYMGSQREEQARRGVEQVSSEIDSDIRAFPPPPPMANVYGAIPNIPDHLRDSNWDPGGGDNGSSFERYPDYNVPSGVGNGGGGVVVPGPVGEPPRFIPDPPPGGDDNGSGGTGRPPIYNALPLPLPGPGVIVHPDGPTDGIGTYPGGHTPLLPGGSGGPGGLGGVGSGGSGSGGLSSGFMAGAGGAAALGGLGKAAAAGGLGRLGGIGGVGGGGAGIAGRGGAGGLGGGLTANAGGGAGGGLLGKGGVGAGGAAGAAGEAGGSRGATGMMGGGGAGAGAGGGGRSDKKGRGLGGPIAPSIEDDAEFGPRSEGAGAGGRD
ncbi:hypothetical protein [Microbacterium binotii]|uniref:hypothetical protein n=1 Tax=Microbacterium binotii TaxID=462710 RepID=UPI002277C2A6|nr:hypothetical protein [Microbacterium binotii]